jgi:hypothetical protein
MIFLVKCHLGYWLLEDRRSIFAFARGGLHLAHFLKLFEVVIFALE